MSTAHELAVQALVTKYLADVTAQAMKGRRVELQEALANGDRVTGTAPGDGTELGCVSRSKPSGTGVITDRTAFVAWMAEHYPEHVETVTQIAAGQEASALAVLASISPDLVSSTTRVREWAEVEVLRCTERAQHGCGPGGEADIPGVAYQQPGPGTVIVRLASDAPATIERLWREGRIDLTAGTIHALPVAVPDPDAASTPE